MWINYPTFLVIALATHAILGYVVGRLLFDRPMAGIAGALAADVDFLFPATVGWPFVHRGISHSFLVLGITTTALVAYRSSTGGAFGVGYLTHLVVDSTTPKGVPLLYPFVEHSFYADFPTTGHSPVPTALLWVGCLVILYREVVVSYLSQMSVPLDMVD